MDRERIRAAREKLRELMMDLPAGVSEPGDELMAAMDDIDDSPNDGEPDAFVGVPTKRPPHRNSGAIALPEPEEPR